MKEAVSARRQLLSHVPHQPSSHYFSLLLILIATGMSWGNSSIEPGCGEPSEAGGWREWPCAADKSLPILLPNSHSDWRSTWSSNLHRTSSTAGKNAPHNLMYMLFLTTPSSLLLRFHFLCYAHKPMISPQVEEFLKSEVEPVLQEYEGKLEGTVSLVI